MKVENGNLKKVLITGIGLLSPITVAGAKWQFIPDPMLLICACLASAMTALLGYLLQPPTNNDELLKLIEDLPRPFLGDDDHLVPPTNSETGSC